MAYQQSANAAQQAMLTADGYERETKTKLVSVSLFTIIW